jgi:phage/plasmid primase-like uncharacterized protein
MSIHDALRDARITPLHFRQGTQRLACPQCNKGAKDRALSLTFEADGGVVWHCFRCAWSGGSHGDAWLNAYAGASVRIDSSKSALRQAAARARLEEKQRESAQRTANAAERAREIWAAAQPAPADHPYLQRKRLADCGLRYVRQFQSLCDALLIPMRDHSGVICNLQGIDRTGAKRFMFGAQTSSAFALVNVAGGSCWRRDVVPEFIGVGEGFATMVAFARMYREHRAVAAMSAGNLVAVAKIIGSRFPDAQIRIAGDQDRTGLIAACEAAKAVGGVVWLPGFQRAGVNDWADVAEQNHQHG